VGGNSEAITVENRVFVLHGDLTELKEHAGHQASWATISGVLSYNEGFSGPRELETAPGCGKSSPKAYGMDVRPYVEKISQTAKKFCELVLATTRKKTPTKVPTKNSRKLDVRVPVR